MAVTEKSEACEKLLVEIQRATEQANEKKAMAVGKREEIAEQNKEIVVEKADAEEALAQALPALEEAKLALQDLDKSDVTEIRCSTLMIISSVNENASMWKKTDEDAEMCREPELSSKEYFFQHDFSCTLARNLQMVCFVCVTDCSAT